MKHGYGDPRIYPNVQGIQHVLPSTQMCHDLPLELQLVLTEVRQSAGADDDLIINSMLSAMSVAVQASTDIIHPLTNNVIPLSLYCITVAGSGARKSTVDSIFMAPFHAFEQEQEKANDKLDEKYEADKEAYDARLKSLRSKLKKANDNENIDDQKKYKSEMDAHLKTKPARAPKIRILVNDATQEKLQIELGKPWNKVCLNNDEAGIFFNTRNFAQSSYYNTLWGAKPQNIERTDDKPRYAIDYRFGMHLMMQPPHFSKFIRLHGEEVRENGFLARCLFSFIPLSRQHNKSTADQENTLHLNKFTDRITTLLNIANNKFRCGQFNEHRKLSVTNQDALRGFHEQCERFLGNTQHPEFALRATEHALRLAGVMHAFLCDDDNDSVDDDILSSAFKMTHAFADRYQKAVNHNELTQELVIQLLCFINDNSRFTPQLKRNAINKSTLLQKGPTKLRKKEQLDMALEALVSTGDIRRERIHNCWYYYNPNHTSVPYMGPY